MRENFKEKFWGKNLGEKFRAENFGKNFPIYVDFFSEIDYNKIILPYCRRLSEIDITSARQRHILCNLKNERKNCYEPF